MSCLRIATPVKDSIDLTLETIHSVLASRVSVPFTYVVYNDFSAPENTLRLQEAANSLGFELINLSDLTNHPSPNYLLVLQLEQRHCLDENADLVIVESDVIVRKDTIESLYSGARRLPSAALCAAVTTNEKGCINYPYAFAEKLPKSTCSVKKHCSFCCTLLTNNFLRAYDFKQLDAAKNWFDVTISHKALQLGFHNYLFVNLPVLHRPHASRPWKQLKYKNPLKYYWYKFTRHIDKI